MKTSNRFYSFPHPSLLLAVDSQSARVWFAHEREITELYAYRVPSGETKERRPLFRASGRGKMLRAGAPEKQKQAAPPAALFHAVNRASLAALHERSVEDVFLFAPRHLLARVKRNLHPYVRQRMQRAFAGDYLHTNPTTLTLAITKELRPAS
jgi:hypothetical protein